MPTRAERTALIFVSGVLIVGGVVRLFRASHEGIEPAPAAAAALADQRRAVDSAGHSRGSTRGRANPAGARSTKPPNARPAASDSQRVSGTAQGRKSVRRRSDSTAARLSNPSAGRSSGLAPQGSALSTPKHPPKARGGTPLIDVDYASVEELEVLPHVGPALAARIVTNRQAGGRFGSLDSLVARVKGIGPVTATVLRPLVTFGGR